MTWFTHSAPGKTDGLNALIQQEMLLWEMEASFNQINNPLRSFPLQRETQLYNQVEPDATFVSNQACCYCLQNGSNAQVGAFVASLILPVWQLYTSFRQGPTSLTMAQMSSAMQKALCSKELEINMVDLCEGQFMLLPQLYLA